MPIAMPAAPYASAATSPRPSKKPPARSPGCRRRRRPAAAAAIVGTAPVWPPPSPPCAMHRVDAPLGDLLGVALGADRRHHDEAARPCSRLISVLPRRLREADATFTPSRIISVDARRRRRARRRAGSRRTGWSVRSFTSRIAATSWSKVHRRAGEDAERRRRSRSPTTSRGPATQPMPVCTIGYVDAERGRRARVCSAGMRSRRGPRRRRSVRRGRGPRG